MKRLTKSKKLSKTKLKSDAYHHGELRKSLIDAAVKLLATRAPDQVSLRELARIVGVSQAAPYRHFASKQDLFAAISQQGFELKASYIRQAMEAHASDPQEMFFSAAEAYLDMGLHHTQHFKLMLRSEVCPSPEYPELLQAAARTFVLLKQLIVICQNAGIIGPGDPYHRAMHCWMVVNGFTTLYIDGRLEWTGTLGSNAKAALRILMTQYLAGARSELVEKPDQFVPFATEYGLANLDNMKSLETAGTR